MFTFAQIGWPRHMETNTSKRPIYNSVHLSFVRERAMDELSELAFVEVFECLRSFGVFELSIYLAFMLTTFYCFCKSSQESTVTLKNILISINKIRRSVRHFGL
jgi:hypothetical protein